MGGGPGGGCSLAPLGQEGVALLFGVVDGWHLIIFGQQGLRGGEGHTQSKQPNVKKKLVGRCVYIANKNNKW